MDVANQLSSLSPTVRLVVIAVMTALTVQIIRWLVWYRSLFRFFNQLPGETDFSWVWGNLRKMRSYTSEQRTQYLLEYSKKYPKFFRLWLGPLRPLIFLNHPDTMKTLLKSSEPKSHIYKFTFPWLGEGLLSANGPRWYRSRRLLTPAFHFDILKPYNTISNRAADVLLDKMSVHAVEKTSMEIYSSVSLCTLDVILQCAMSYKDDIQLKGESHPYVQAVMQLTDMLTERARNPLFALDFIYFLSNHGRKFKALCDFAHSVAENVIKARKERLEREGPPKKRHLDFLDILLTARDESGHGFTPLELRNEVNTFMFAGHDTTASAIAWTLYSLAQHPQYQQKVQEELDCLLAGRQSDDIEWEDLQKLEYLTQVIKEGMRLHSTVPFVSRTLTKPMTIEDVTLPAGTWCRLNMIGLHHNPLVWSDAEAFDPERFHPDNIKDKDAYTFVPFSAGPRNCIGQHFALNEQKVIIGRILRKFTLTVDPNHKVQRKIALVTRPETGLRLLLTPRPAAVWRERSRVV
ncbi:cytochrome P450 4A24-like [Pomacea canaliculata]|uniref:cytochrome P450 4A24-like n=1 Tax=Pomacea canaliculata TaxID=400727 RepID=UPI000D72B1CB|nr:cytochrome P450 4A24-like [Pomacea canaliculata]